MNENIESLWEKRRQEFKEMGIDEERARRIWGKMGLSADEIEYGVGVIYNGKSSSCSVSSSSKLKFLSL